MSIIRADKTVKSKKHQLTIHKTHVTVLKQNLNMGMV